MKLAQLRYVVAVVDEGSMTGAAACLHVAQPAVSQGVRALEQELGVDLFRRVGRRLELTDAGREVVTVARRALADLDALPARARSVAEAGRSRVAVVSTYKLSPYCTAAARALAAGRPDARVSLAMVGRTDEVAAALRAGTAEVGVTHLPLAAVPGFDVEVVGEQGFVAVLPPGSRHERDTITRAELAGYPLIAPLPGSRHRRVFDRRFGDAGAEPRIVLELDTESRDLPAAVIVETGATIAYRVDADEFRRLGATVVELDPPMARPVAVAHRGSAASPAARDFVDAVRDTVHADPAASPRPGAVPAAD